MNGAMFAKLDEVCRGAPSALICTHSDNLWSLVGSLDLKFLEVSLSFTDLIFLEHPFPWFQAKRWEEFLRRQSMRYNAGAR